MKTALCRCSVVRLVLFLRYSSRQVTAGGQLDFIPLSFPSTVPTGDDTFSEAIPFGRGFFKFGNGTVDSVYVSTNGYISMGITPTVNAQRTNSIVAPYAADIDTSVTGTVRYTEFMSNRFNLLDVSNFIEEETGVTFEGTRMMVAEWDGVAQYNGDPSITSTFQCVLITDGSASYAVFIYECGGMEWGGAEIGWQASNVHAAKHSLSGAESAKVGCEYSFASSAIVYILESCSSDQFTCDSGECVDEDAVCDGDYDCGDRSDEEQDCNIFDTHGTLIIVCAVVGFAVLCVLILCIILTVCRLYKRHYLATQTHTSSTTPSPGTTTTVTTTSSNHESSFTNPIQYPTQQTGYSKEAEFMSEAPPTYNTSATFQSVEMGHQNHYEPRTTIQSQAVQMPYPSAPPQEPDIKKGGYKITQL